MSAVMQSVDPTRGHNLVAMRADNLEVVRYLFFAGNVLDPDRVLQLEYMRGGGEEVQAHCLRRSVNGFIPRARLTPLETWAEPLPPVLIGEGAERDTVRIQGPTTPELLGAGTRRPGGLAGVGATMVHVKYYPGDELPAILRANEGKGIREIASLAGQPWYEDESETKPGLPQLLNYDFFPALPPPTLSGLREAITAKESASEVHKAVSREMLTSCDQFERWAQARLAAEHTLLRQRTSPNGQHTYTYSPVARDLLKQLEMKPQDTIMEQASGISAEQLQAIIAGAGSGGVNAETIGQIVGAVTNQILAAQAANAPVDNRTPAEKRADTLARKRAEEANANIGDVGGGSN